jgi:transposase
MTVGAPAAAPLHRTKRDERHERLVEAARSVFVKRGLPGARTREIADAAGVSEAVLYRHFGSKTEMFDAAVLGPLEEFSRSMAAAGKRMPAASRRERHAMSYELHVELFRAMQVMGPLLNSAPYQEDDAGQPFYDEHLAPLLTQVQASIEAAMSGWAFEGGDPQLVTVMSLGTYHWLALQARFGHPVADTTEVASRFLGFIMRALEVRPPPLGHPQRYDPAGVGTPIGELAWQVLEPLLPAGGGQGGQWRNHRAVLEAAAWKARTGLPWRRLPHSYGPWQTVWKRVRRWQSDGTWDRMIAALERAPAAAEEAQWMRVLAESQAPLSGHRSPDPDRPLTGERNHDHQP